MGPQWGHNGAKDAKMTSLRHYKGAKTYKVHTLVENMQNIEKTIQSILKKFEVWDEYEKR